MTETATPYPWLDAYPPSLSWEMELMGAPLYSILDHAAKEYPDHQAIHFLGKTYTYQALWDMTNRVAKGLREIGVERGTRVVLFMPNCPQFIMSYYGVLKAGGIVVNCNPLYSLPELRALLDDAQADIIITMNLKSLYGKVMSLLAGTSLQKVVICHLQDVLPFPKNILFPLLHDKDLAKTTEDVAHIHFKDLLENDGLFVPPVFDPDTTCAVLQYTGGTTGLPKAAMLTHSNLYINAHQAGAWFTSFEDGNERMLGVLPLFHVFAMTVVMNMSLSRGACIHLFPRFDVDQVLEAIESQEITLFPAVPSIFVAVNKKLENCLYNLKSLKACISGGAPLPLQVKERFETSSQCRLVEGYGLTECSPVVAVNPFEGNAKDGAIGLPLPQTKISIRDRDTGEACEAGAVGELCVQGPQTIQHYWERPQESEQLWQDGWLHTGDMAYMDEEGYVFVVDRIKDMIITHGYNVYPRNIEEVLHQHPKVQEAAVVGVDDEKRGQVIRAFIVGRGDENPTEEELASFLKDKLAPFELPKEYIFSEELPKTLIGKIDKKELLNYKVEAEMPQEEVVSE